MASPAVITDVGGLHHCRTVSSAIVVPSSRRPTWPAEPCCRRPGLPANFTLSRNVLHLRGLPG